MRRFRAIRRLRRRQKLAEAVWELNQSTLSLIGQMTIAWASIEYILDEFIEWHSGNIRELPLAKLPKPFSKKMEALYAIATDGVFVDTVSSFLLSLHARISECAEDRHTFIHGLGSRQSSADLNWYFQRKVIQGPSVTIEHTIYTPEDIRELSWVMHQIAADMAPTLWLIMGRQLGAFSIAKMARARQMLGI